MIFITLISTLLAFAYGVFFTRQPPSALRSFVKCAATGLLALISILNGGPGLLSIALILGMTGDFFLAQKTDKGFLPGLAAFLVGHLALVWLFFNHGEPPQILISQTWRLVALAVLLLFAGAMVTRLWRHLGAMRLPVLAYIATIAMMGFAAFLLPAQWPLMLAIIGAALFIASDAILSVELFLLEDNSAARSWTAPTLWFLYWGAQALILAAFILN